MENTIAILIKIDVNNEDILEYSSIDLPPRSVECKTKKKLRKILGKFLKNVPSKFIFCISDRVPRSCQKIMSYRGKLCSGGCTPQPTMMDED